jgi:hypothetical protein
MQFRKWIVASSKDDAVSRAKEYWDAQKVISASSSYMEMRDVLSNRTPGAPNDVEYCVFSEVECANDNRDKLLKQALMNGWDRQDRD